MHFNLKHKTRWYFLMTLMSLLVIYLLLGFLASQNMFYTPSSSKVDLSPLFSQDTFSEEDYALLFDQTGLAPPAIDDLIVYPDFASRILRFQENYLRSIDVSKTNMNAITRIDKAFDDMGSPIDAFELAPFDNGYIFLTKSTYTANWRHGHAGIVIDADENIILESLEPGTESMAQNTSKWQQYPTFKMMRLKDTAQEYLDAIAAYAKEHLSGIPYNILSSKNQKLPLSTTHCSLIVWQAFKHFGIDLDSNGGFFVSPEDLATSPYLETVQIFGFHPDKTW